MILDTSIWIALLDEDDSCHPSAAKLVENINPQDLYLSDYVYCETMTVLRRKKLEFKIHELMHFINNLDLEIKYIDQSIFNLANRLFLKYHKLSFTDCTLIAVAQMNRSKLITFDKHLLKAYHQIVN